MASTYALFDRRCRIVIETTVSTQYVSGSKFNIVTSNVLEINAGTVGSKRTIGQRVKFKIDKTLKKEPNNSEITITNLSPDHRAQMQQKGVKVSLEAGYVNESRVTRYFSGDVRTIDHIRNGADWDTVLRLGDGERAWKYSRINESFAPGITVADAIKKIAGRLGVDLGNLERKLAGIQSQLAQGHAASGSASKALDQLITSIGKTWSIQDGELQILDPYETIVQATGDIPEISPSSGLIGSPEVGTPDTKGKKAIINIKSLLIPVRVGGKVKLISEKYPKGVEIRVVSATFTGDTSGQEWYTDISGSLI